MKRRKGDPYEVGYQKPPEHTRFKKGESGNPKGRPKGSLSVAAELNKALNEVITVVVNGKHKRITKLTAAVTALVNRAIQGDARAMQQLLALGPLVGMDIPGSTPGATDAAVMADLLKRLSLSDESPPEDE